MPSTIPTTYPESQGGYLAPPNYSSWQNIETAREYARTHSISDSYDGSMTRSETAAHGITNNKDRLKASGTGTTEPLEPPWEFLPRF